jgi:hypothetical protein
MKLNHALFMSVFLVLATPLVAQKKSTSRQKVISSEKSFTVKKGAKDSQKLDFDSTDIGGERKAPLGSLINQSKSDKNFDFIKIRLRWHPEMISSASELDSGGL